MTRELFATTSKGLYAFTLTGDVSLIGLQNSVVSDVAARDGILLAAVPVIAQVHEMMGYVDGESPDQKSGLYLFDLSGERQHSKLVCAGNLKSCGIGQESATGKQRWYAGIEPADVLISEDQGGTWSSTNSFKAISARDSWYECLLCLHRIAHSCKFLSEIRLPS